MRWGIRAFRSLLPTTWASPTQSALSIRPKIFSTNTRSTAPGALNGSLLRLDGKTSSTIAATCTVPSVHGTDFTVRSRARSDKLRSRFSDCDCHSGAFRKATGCSSKVVQKALADFFSFNPYPPLLTRSSVGSGERPETAPRGLYDGC